MVRMIGFRPEMSWLSAVSLTGPGIRLSSIVVGRVADTLVNDVVARELGCVGISGIDPRVDVPR